MGIDRPRAELAVPLMTKQLEEAEAGSDLVS